MLINKVSVIIPARNAGSTILEALNSAIQQTHSPYEIIVVDDKSEDDTANVVRSLGEKVILINGEGKGSGPARNLGVSHSKGDLIAFLDADDAWMPEKLAKQMLLVQEGSIVGAYANYFVGHSSKIVGTSIRTSDDTKALKFILDGKGMPMLLSSFLMTRKDFDSVGGFDPTYYVSQDYELLLRACIAGIGIRIVREPLLRYRLHLESETLSQYVKQYLTAVFVREKHLKGVQQDFNQWLESQLKNPRRIRRAKAGLLFRRGAVNLETGSPFKGISQMAVAVILDPKRAVTKVIQQASFGFGARSK
jgi:glycosyltransferase involved in cell wall biosynthesis